MSARSDAARLLAWSASDLASNALRGMLAEYIVATCLDEGPALRREWGAVDLRTRAGVTVEVKSAAYLQSWAQARPSVIRFDIAPKPGWDARTGV